ncbi:hypothetical protein CANCADRAFT_42987 [Tortispora caseinolytica NRRL Y-17796]|uniref:MIP18 family-like domain-containing protein n=1 Tax=Tortispora caseinolytica NRRL Y-17796 TaxID=767744 RepID=A0A1E4TKU8_9ASCO|nr:hypothetical protein CANCADRAFT_42987 [Tortispora caseinolytica NRRL Y-17796]
MSDQPINENPTVLSANDLPQREGAANFTKNILLDIVSAPLDIPLYDSDISSISESDEEEPIDEQEIFDLISTISDPEHPLSLGQLAVVNLPDITVKHPTSTEYGLVHVIITPTITHCSLATLIGLGIRIRLERSLPPSYRIDITVKPGSHQSQNQVNRQLNDKERVAAACENDQLMGVVTQMLSTCT